MNRTRGAEEVAAGRVSSGTSPLEMLQRTLNNGDMLLRFIT